MILMLVMSSPLHNRLFDEEKEVGAHGCCARDFDI